MGKRAAESVAGGGRPASPAAFAAMLIVFVGLAIAATAVGPGPPARERICLGPVEGAEGGTLRLYLSRSTWDAGFPLAVATQGGPAAGVEVDPIRRVLAWPSGRRTAFPAGRGTLLVFRSGRTAWVAAGLPVGAIEEAIGRLGRGAPSIAVGELLYRIARAVARDRLDRRILDFAGR